METRHRDILDKLIVHFSRDLEFDMTVLALQQRNFLTQEVILRVRFRNKRTLLTKSPLCRSDTNIQRHNGAIRNSSTLCNDAAPTPFEACTKRSATLINNISPI